MSSPSRVPHVASYRRVLPVSLDRLYENALDWEHLPWLHHSSFRSIDVSEAGDWGWRAAIVTSKGGASRIELRLDREARRWITRTLEGPGVGTEIWTHAFAVEPERTDIVVDFFVPGVPSDKGERVGSAYVELYTRLYDEDVAMMVERQRQLDARASDDADRGETLALGPRAELSLPCGVELGGRRWRVIEIGGFLHVHATLCPHWLGPLEDAALAGFEVECPWHGYRFDVRNGACTSGARCRLPAPPRVVHDAATDEVTLVGGERETV